MLMLYISGGKLFIQNWINPFGIIFINLLKLIAIPLILASIIKGISDLKDIAQFKTIGVRSVTLFITTTIASICIGLLLVNVFTPGKGISVETVSRITNEFVGRQGVQSKLAEASVQKESPPLQFLLDMVPENVFSAMSDNKLMLQVIFFSVFLGVSMLLIGEAKAKPLKSLFDSLNDAVIKMVDIIMVTAPFAVFALLANVVASSGDPDLLLALVKYAGVVILEIGRAHVIDIGYWEKSNLVLKGH